MGNDIQNKISQLKEILKESKYMGAVSSVLYWDMSVMAPSKSHEFRGEVLGYLSAQHHKLTTSEKMKKLVEDLAQIESLDGIEKAMVMKCKRDFDKSSKIPEDKVREFSIITAKAGVAWEEAKEKSDFEIFRPHLEKVVQSKKDYIELLGYDKDKYDVLLDDFERGMTVEKIDVIFAELKDSIVELLNKIKNSRTDVNKERLRGVYSEEAQKEFSEYLLKDMGYDFEAGRLDKSAHPFTIGLEPNDVRITTRYNESDFTEGIFGSIHEGGHALYEQGISEKLAGTGLDEASTAGIHESQSLFYESLIGSSKEYWKRNYDALQQRFSEFKEMKFEDFYRDINEVKPSLIRVEADELTYCLHIIIRYEIEKALMNDEIEVKDLPEIWNNKYKEYLGIEPQNDAEGVLQDMHWTDVFGYFPSYALGRLYSAQFLSHMKKDIPDVMKQVESGDLKVVLGWLRENIHKHGDMYTPNELVKMATGEELNAKYFIDYLNDKYSKIYNL